MTTEQITAKTAEGAKLISEQVKRDIADFRVPVTREPKAWAAWIAETLDEMGMDAMAAEMRQGLHIHQHAKVIAFETLYELGGYESPRLCLPLFLDDDKNLRYWRAIAIAANTGN